MQREKLYIDKVQKEKMSTQGQDLGDGLNSSDSADGNVQFIEVPKVNHPGFLTPTRDAQVMSMSPAIPSWLTNTIKKKRNFQPVSTPVKDIVTKYASRGSKANKLKTNAHLTMDLVTRKIIADIATYKQKKESEDIDDERFKVTSAELGTINRSMSN